MNKYYIQIPKEAVVGGHEEICDGNETTIDLEYETESVDSTFTAEDIINYLNFEYGRNIEINESTINMIDLLMDESVTLLDDFQENEDFIEWLSNIK